MTSQLFGRRKKKVRLSTLHTAIIFKILVFNDLGLSVVCKTTLQKLLGIPNYTFNNLDKSVIYKIQCKECNLKYYCQTRRSIRNCFKAHSAHTKYDRLEKSTTP